jgi:Holliday junction resolvasome RuvABC endonuclease subunit
MNEDFTVAGIDYSMTSPAICVHKGATWNFKNCKFFYVVNKDKHLVITDQLKGSLYPMWETDPERYDNLSKWSLSILNQYSVNKVFIEGYAFNSVGRVFQIAENTGTLKSNLWKENFDYDVYPPTMIKKFGCGKGNANKEKMWEAFKEETDYNIFNILGQEEGKHWNPISDIVDAYYIAKLGLSNINS